MNEHEHDNHPADRSPTANSSTPDATQAMAPTAPSASPGDPTVQPPEPEGAPHAAPQKRQGKGPDINNVYSTMDRLPCCQHATSIAGLGTLQRLAPRRWARLLQQCFPAEILPGSAVRCYLDAGAGGLLQPTHAGDRSYRKKRASARYIAEELGDLLIKDLTEADLIAARRRYSAAPLHGRSQALRSADLRVLRQAVHRGQIALGLDPVARTWTRRRGSRADHRRRRPHAAPVEVQRLLKMSSKRVAGAIAYIVGCGLLTEEVLSLHAGDVRLPEGLVAVSHAMLRGKPGVGTDHLRRLPQWARELVERAWPRLSRMRPDELLFAQHGAPERPWTGLCRALRGAAIAAELCLPGDHDDRWTPTGLRRLYQAVARANKVPRALVRGTVPTAHPEYQANAVRFWLQASDRMAKRWVYLLRPPNYDLKRKNHVPLRAPAGVKADQLEYPNLRTQRWALARRVPQDLPPGCQDVPGHVVRSVAKRAPTTLEPVPTLADAGVPSQAPPVVPPEVPCEPAPAAEPDLVDAFEAGALGGFAVGTLVGLNLPRKEEKPDDG